MCDVLLLLVHLLTTLVRLLGPGGTRAVVAETLQVKHQLVILNRSRRRAPNLTPLDRIAMGLCMLLMNPSRIRKVAKDPSDVGSLSRRVTFKPVFAPLQRDIRFFRHPKLAPP